MHRHLRQNRMKRLTAAMLAFFLLVGAACGGDEDSSASPTRPWTQVLATSTTSPLASLTVSPQPSTATPAPPAPTGTPPAEGESGVRGIVLIGPNCPVVQANSPCPDRPFEATIQLLDEQGDVVDEVRSGADGRFTFIVAPGTYTLHSPISSSPPSAPDQPVTVEENAFTDVVFTFDSGIR